MTCLNYDMCIKYPYIFHLQVSCETVSCHFQYVITSASEVFLSWPFVSLIVYLFVSRIVKEGFGLT